MSADRRSELDRIIVHAIPLDVRVGVTEEEREREQKVAIDVELGLDLASAAKADALEHTVDYEKVCDVVAATVRSRSWILIEAIVDACAVALLDVFPVVAEVRLQIRKPGALRSRGVPYAAAEVVRRRG